ncbi:hypothetical protein N0V84_011157 [Fusarium piperis]|uniref:Uncharacterized protein n=1 Tax=Fusarium piperis TaxID=1435070 RepID=A0A9W8TEY7_9HYPO|nr:hypothetical protein N0V84_011157 [Fusarium piperis]
MDSTLPSLGNDSNAPGNVGDSNLSESLAEMDLEPSSSSEDKRSRQESEPAAEETDQSSPPTKRQRREQDNDEGEKDGDDDEQQDVAMDDQENSGEGSQQQDDVDRSEDASQQHDTVQDDAEMGSLSDNDANSSPPAYADDEEPPPYQPANPSPTISIAEGSMISFDMPLDENLDDMPPLVEVDQQEEDAVPASEVSHGAVDDGTSDVVLASFFEEVVRSQTRNVTRPRRRRSRTSTTPRPEWVFGVRNRPGPRRMVTGREYLRQVTSESWEHSDDEGR